MGTKNNRHNAFTLIELLITLTVVALLAVIATMYLRGQSFKGNDARRKADIGRIKVAVEEYEKDHNCYPQYVVCGVNKSQPIHPYLNNVPCDPITNAAYYYDYEDSTCPGWFRFYSELQFTADSDVTSGIGPNSAFNYVSGSANAPGTSHPGSGGGSVPTPTPQGGESTPIVSSFYGCRSGACVQIGWNPNRPGPECDPSFQDSNCYRQCGPTAVECVNVP